MVGNVVLICAKGQELINERFNGLRDKLATISQGGEYSELEDVT